MRAIALAAVLSLLAVPAGAQTIPPSFFGMSLEYTTDTPWPKLYVGNSRTWFSDGSLACVGFSGVPAIWQYVEPGQNFYNWPVLDCVVADYRSHGVTPIFTFGMTPSWASGSGQSELPDRFRDERGAAIQGPGPALRALERAQQRR